MDSKAVAEQALSAADVIWDELDARSGFDSVIDDMDKADVRELKGDIAGAIVCAFADFRRDADRDRLQAENEQLRAELHKWRNGHQLQSFQEDLDAEQCRRIDAENERGKLRARVAELSQENFDLHLAINTPRVDDFVEGVRLEAAHQRERWSAEHDAGKSDADWFWLLGYLAGKAIRPDCSPQKRLHHIITTAAACLNWHAHATGIDTRMRPGIEPPHGSE